MKNAPTIFSFWDTFELTFSGNDNNVRRKHKEPRDVSTIILCFFLFQPPPRPPFSYYLFSFSLFVYGTCFMFALLILYTFFFSSRYLWNIVVPFECASNKLSLENVYKLDNIFHRHSYSDCLLFRFRF